jgi:hypothetical protein
VEPVEFARARDLRDVAGFQNILSARRKADCESSIAACR